jgi:hypothetical protein
VPVWIERFALAVLAALFVGIVIMNALKFDWIQRTGLGMGILGLSIFLAQTLYVSNKAKADTNTPPQGEQKKPEVQQSSQGATSPNTNIVGNNNTVINGDPQVAARLDEITKLLRAQGDQTSPKKLLARYPLGYTIFDVDYTNSVYPYQSRALETWDFDWSVVTLRRDTKFGSADTVWMRIPDIRRKGGGGPRITNANIGGPKKVGPFGGGAIFTDGVITMKGEILAIRESGIVFLIGFTNAEPKKGS